MLEVNIPGFGELKIKHIVFDLNGTLSMNGEIDPALPNMIKELKLRGLNVYILSADTRGKLNELAKKLGAEPHKLTFKMRESEEKANFIKQLNPNSVIAVGNGINDALMLKEARLGICIIGKEGAAVSALLNSDICVNSPKEALNILLDPIHLIATLRNSQLERNSQLK